MRPLLVLGWSSMPEIRLTKEAGLAWLIIDHPERRNALNPEMMQQLSVGLDEVAKDISVRAIVLTGAGDKAFASGGDISRFGETRKDFEASQESAAKRKAVFAKMGAMDKPVVSMIRGYCMGGGMALALQTDLRFASTDATFAIPAAKLGIAYGPEGIEKLVALVGSSVAKDILFSARRITADEALAMGLINKVLTTGELEAFTRDYCLTLAKNAPLSIASSKFIIEQLALPAGARDTIRITDLQRAAAESDDIKEGRAAFLEKRPAKFVGK
ncbi:enoyl-CoA hydratase-related protein [Corticibacterium sp. UT-5YL-CI-8]|nr:enoyl-CoA hydratase-related protein [Tianweitania sp. UT-5YL-CI-8]